MPGPFNKAKMTGDTHPPEVELDLPLQEGSAEAAGLGDNPSDRGRGIASGRESKPAGGVKKAGLPGDHDGTQPQGQQGDRPSGRGSGDRT